ncbi:MAG: PilW family protein [Thalassotalea sp.]|nr:PilW family protein [Thalassotalea sp.]
MNNQKGFTLLELFIAMTMGLVLFAGVMSVFVGMRTTSDETSRYGVMQEKGRFVISILSEDLMRQGFFGDLMVPPSTSVLTSLPAAPVGDCTGDGLNNASFPLAVGSYRTLWGETVTSASIMGGCVTNAKTNSDVIQLKRTLSSEHTGARTASRYYLVSNYTEGVIIDDDDAMPVINDSRMFEYQHHIYYVQEETRGNDVVPMLYTRTLSANMQSQPLVDGIERIRFMYGVDTDLDGYVNAFFSADDMNSSGGGAGALWDNASSQILAVKMYVLVRDLFADADYTNSTVYQMGAGNDGLFTAPDDNYRRMLFSSTVSLYNGDVKVWD